MTNDTDATFVPDFVDADSGPAEEPWFVYLRLLFSQNLLPYAPELGRYTLVGTKAKGTVHVGRTVDRSSGATALEISYDKWISRDHARVYLDGDEIVINDLESRNGTFLDGERVHGEVRAKPGQVLRFGQTIFLIGHAPLGRAARIKKATPVPDSIDGWSWTMLAAWEVAASLAQREGAVLLLGETGTGKTQLAKQIHRHSKRCDRPFISHNCAAIPANLEEATLFGVVAGFVTGVTKSQGLIKSAGQGTLFLDELSELSLGAQGKLLDAFDTTDPSYLPLGASERQQTRCRLISATNADVGLLVSQDRMRGDLVSRLVSAQLRVPPLRERREDLLRMFAKFVGDEDGNEEKQLIGSPEAAEAMLLSPWPENVRGLSSLALCAKYGETITVDLARQYGERGAASLPVANAAVGPTTGAVEEPRGSDIPTGEFTVDAIAESAGESASTQGETTAAWPPSPEELLDLLDAHHWKIAEVARAAGRRRETVSRLISTTFGKGGKAAARRAHRLWKATGRVPDAQWVDLLHTAYFDDPNGDKSAKIRSAWQAGESIDDTLKS